MTQPVIEVKHLTKSFDHWTDQPHSFKNMLTRLSKGNFNLFTGGKQFTVLKDVNFDIYPGEFVGIMGRNGAGKSTILKLISGIYSPTSGNIETRAVIAPLIELGAGFHPDLSGYENIFLNAAILGFGKKATESIIPAILEFSELGDQIHKPIRNYSSGMLARLGFSVAINLAAPVLLIDEILAVGDAGFQEKCLAQIDKIHSEGRTVVLITHSPEAVERHCTRCVVIDHCEKVFDGNAQDGAEFYKKLVMQMS
jgi:ABC-type polysaccharide/polyol phosphate transport system ATPase subunit